jgi:hypothetical protein
MCLLLDHSRSEATISGRPTRGVGEEDLEGAGGAAIMVCIYPHVALQLEALVTMSGTTVTDGRVYCLVKGFYSIPRTTH